MPLDIKQQIIQQIKNVQNILICFKDITHGLGYPAGGDAVASALALAGILEKHNKNVDIASPDFVLPKWASCLSGAEKIKNNIQAAGFSKISISISESGIKDFSYEISNDFLNIHLSPKEGILNLRNLKTENGLWQYDLIIALDTTELSLLGGLYEKNKPLFDTVPIINIDDSPENENYGQINLVDIKNSSVAEIIWRLIEKSKNLDEKIIDCVLAGIIAKTKNFRRPNINPQTLRVAGNLLSLGAQREKITDGFYRTRDISALKLWGRTLARLKSENNITWALLARTDFIHSGGTENDLPDVIHELLTNSPNAETIALIFESVGGEIKAIIFSNNRLTHKTLPHANLLTAEKELIGELKKII